MATQVRRSIVLGLVFVMVFAWQADAQWIVRDPALILRNRIVAGLQELLVRSHVDQYQRFFRMARRLAAFTSVVKYAVQETPEWRIHDFWTEAVRYARDYHAALNYGDGQGVAYQRITIPLLRPEESGPPRTSEGGWRELASRLATIDATDAVAISTTHAAGLLRYNGRREQEAIEGLQEHVTDPSEEQSVSAVLDKISGATLVGTRQRQARAQFVAGIVEQLVLETKRARDTEATALNMQLTTWRAGDAANRALVDGTGDALSRWRQP